MTDRATFRAASRPLFEELALKPGDVFPVKSSRYDENGITYEMVVTPEGYVVHDGPGCEAEQFRGVRSCRHSEGLEKFVTTSITKYEPMVPQRIEFSGEQLKTIAEVICVDSDGKLAPPAFVELFVAACRHTGLDPFLRQIYALSIRGKWSMFVGIDGYRVISERTGLDAGMDGPQWSDDGKTWLDFPFSEKPAFCRVGIWRKGVPRAYVGVVSMKAKEQPNSESWRKDAAGMLAKCAEALARRRAFPADMAVIPTDAVFEAEDDPRWQEPSNLAQRTGFAVVEGQVVDRETGEVIEHGDPQEDRDKAGLPPAGSAPAAPPEHGVTQQASVRESNGGPGTGQGFAAPAAPPPATTSEAQRASITEWHEGLKGNHKREVGAAVKGWFEAAFPYAEGHILDLTQDDASRYIRLLMHVCTSKDGAVPADGGEPTHDWVADAKTADVACSVCRLPEPEEAAQAALPT